MTNCKPTSLPYGLKLLAVWVVGLMSPCQAQTITWLHPTAAGGYKMESAIPDPRIAVRVTTKDGQAADSAEALAKAGWQWTEDRFWQNLRGASRETEGRRLNVSVSGLPAGRHKVYLRYFEMPRPDGDNWWYFPTIHTLGGARISEKRIVAGTGGVDRSNVYDALIGTAGTETEPATHFELGFEKYEWASLNRYGSIRIESELSIDAPETAEDAPLNRRVRAALLEHGPKGADGLPAYGLAAVSDSLKVRPKSFAALADQPLPGELRLAAARGEYASRQVVVHSSERELTGVTLACSPLTADSGRVIPADALRFAPVGYVSVNVPHVVTEHGWWPEPILTFLDRFNVKRGDVQTLWYQVQVPRDAAPGLYRGTVKIKPDNARPADLPVELRVWDFDMPRMPHLRVVMGCGNDPAGDPFELPYGIQPSSIYGGINSDEHLKMLPAWAKSGATAINLAYVNEQPRDPKTNTPTVPSKERLDEMVETIGRRYQAATEAGLRKACYVYLYDEAGSEWVPAMKAVAERLRAEFPDLLLLTTSPTRGHQDLQAIDGWCPLVCDLQEFAKSAAKVQAEGKQLWWYTCNSPPRPWANLFLTQPAMAHRLLMGFMAFAARTDGFLYYASYGGWARNSPISTGPYTGLQPSRDSDDWLYLRGPGGITDHVPTLRLEAIRAGLQDYNYLHIAGAVRAELQAAGLETPELKAQAEALGQYATPGNDLVKSMTDFVQDPETLEAVKQRLGTYIEQAKQALRK